ncbi:hypothetical protein JD77_02182 [Micromonospora olivasterospora]|uniref:Uncharacterized protein n=1 Tax=Micromonospora olivasterospora TaxID=1880 RepID=A0A562I858_MICOL|nr:hypothetical protein JD77_02182 [Micromonospora olivasterospora]
MIRMASIRGSGGVVPKIVCSGGTVTMVAAKASSNAIPRSRRRLVARPMERSGARSVRAARAVPIWHATMGRGRMLPGPLNSVLPQ